MAAHLGSADSLTLWGGGVVPEKETLPAIAPEPVSPADVTGAAGQAATGSGSSAAPPPYAKAEKAPVATTTKGPLGTIVTLPTWIEFAVCSRRLLAELRAAIDDRSPCPHLAPSGAAGTLGGLSHAGVVFDRLAFPCSTECSATPLPRFDVAAKGGWRVDAK